MPALPQATLRYSGCKNKHKIMVSKGGVPDLLQCWIVNQMKDQNQEACQFASNTILTLMLPDSSFRF